MLALNARDLTDLQWAILDDLIPEPPRHLHGVIVAEAFGIPRQVEYCPRMDPEGGDFKFRDYSASI